jgi:hypothetical protein
MKTYYLLWGLIHLLYFGNSTLKADFKFETPNSYSPLQFTENGYSLTATNPNSFVKIPEITTGIYAREKRGFISISTENYLKFSHELDFSTRTYFIGANVFLEEMELTGVYTLFIVPVMLK